MSYQRAKMNFLEFWHQMWEVHDKALPQQYTVQKTETDELLQDNFMLNL